MEDPSGTNCIVTFDFGGLRAKAGICPMALVILTLMRTRSSES